MPANNADRAASQPVTRYNILNIVAYIANVVVTYGLGVGGLFGRPTNGELSLKYQSLVTPAGYAFAIWGIVFLSQFVWVVLPLVVASKRNSPWINAVGYNYVFVCLSQIGWTIAFSYEYIQPSMVFMTLILLFLSMAFFALKSTSVDLEEESTSIGNKILDYLLYQFPMTIHTGWIVAATLVNANVVVVDLQLSASTQFYVAAASLLSLLLVALVTLIRTPPDFVISLVLSWALVGVYVALLQPVESILNFFSSTQITEAKYGALVLAIVIALGTLVQMVLAIRNSRDRSGEESRYLRASDNGRP